MRMAIALAIMLAFVCQQTSPSVAEDLFTNPTSQMPLLRFHTGKVVANKPEISDQLPNFEGSPTPWVVIQWRRPTILSATDLVPPDPIRFRVGKRSPLHVFADPAMATVVSIFKEGATFPIELREHNGVLVEGGGSNLFLSSDAVIKSDFSKIIKYDVDIGIGTAQVDYDSTEARSSGAVLGAGFSGFRLQMVDGSGKPTISAFIQIQHVTSRNQPADHRGCHARQDGGNPQIVYSRTLNGESYLPFVQTNGKTERFTYVLNSYLLDMVSKPVVCVAEDGRRFDFIWPKEASDGHRWLLTSMFIGLETQNVDARPNASTHDPQGSVDLGLLIRRLSVTVE